MLNQNIQNSIIEIEKKYESKIKEDKIAILEENDHEQQVKLLNRRKLNIVLISFMVFFFLLAFLFYCFGLQLIMKLQRKTTTCFGPLLLIFL